MHLPVSVTLVSRTRRQPLQNGFEPRLTPSHPSDCSPRSILCGVRMHTAVCAHIAPERKRWGSTSDSTEPSPVAYYTASTELIADCATMLGGCGAV